MKSFLEQVKLVYIIALRNIRKVFFVFPVKKNRVIFESFSGDGYSCNPKYISEYLKKEYGNSVEVVWAVKDGVKTPENVVACKYRSFQHFLYRIILTVLYNGIPGQAYNAANEETYCSIYEMAKMVAGRFGDNSVKVLVEETNPEKLGYAPVLYMNLDTTKLHNLGWKAKFNLESMYQNMIEDMKINQKRY